MKVAFGVMLTSFSIAHFSSMTLGAPSLPPGSATPIQSRGGQSYALSRANAEDARAFREISVRQCAASIVQAFGIRTKPAFNISGFGHPTNGGLRVYGAVTSAAHHRATEFSCDVNSVGLVRRLDVANPR